MTLLINQIYGKLPGRGLLTWNHASSAAEARETGDEDDSDDDEEEEEGRIPPV